MFLEEDNYNNFKKWLYVLNICPLVAFNNNNCNLTLHKALDGLDQDDVELEKAVQFYRKQYSIVTDANCYSNRIIGVSSWTRTLFASLYNTFFNQMDSNNNHNHHNNHELDHDYINHDNHDLSFAKGKGNRCRENFNSNKNNSNELEMKKKEEEDHYCEEDFYLH